MFGVLDELCYTVPFMAHKNKTNYSPYKARQEQAGRRPPRPGAQRGRHRRPESIYTANEANDRLYDIFRNHGGEFITHEQRMQFAKFYEILMKEQEHQNFTRLMSIKDVGLKHFIDCALVPKLTKLQFPLMDMGTGPGFPGIPLKILFPKEKIILAEGVQKRVEFLKRVREQLGLQNLDIIGRNIDDNFAYPLRGVITRAVEDIPNTLRNVSQAVEVGGRVYLMKGPGVDPELKMVGEWGEYYKLVEDHHYDIPHTPHKRRLVVFEMVKAPPIKEWDDDDILLEDE